MSSEPRKIFCFGFGYTADYLAHALEGDPHSTLAGTTRDLEKQSQLSARDIEAHIFDYERPLLDPAFILENVTHVLISTPPKDDGDPTFLMHGDDIAALPNLQWVGYLSTTGVYGDRQGEAVYETDEIRPTSQRGSRRAKAEEQWFSLCQSRGVPLHVFRLAGIYGPGRSALDSVRAGVARRIHRDGHAFGRIHVEDIVNVLLTSMAAPQAGEVYNVCDDEPAPSHEVIAYACELLNRPPPPLVEFEDADLAPITRSFYMDNRRTKNNKIKDALGVVLKYPNFRAGLDGCLDAEDYAVSMFKDLNIKN